MSALLQGLASDLADEHDPHKHGKMTDSEKAQTVAFYYDLLHHVSLLFAVMMKQLRKDSSLDDMYSHSMGERAPSLVRLHLFG